MHRHFRDRLLDRWGRLVTSRPKLTLAVCGLLAVVSIVAAITTIQIKADRNALMSEDLPWAHRYATYRADFSRWDDVIICLEGDPVDASIDTLARDLAKHLQHTSGIDNADAGFDASQAGPRLWRVAPIEQFDTTLQELAAGRLITAAETAAAALVTMLQQQADATASPSQLETSLGPWIDAIAGRPVTFDWISAMSHRWQQLRTSSGRIRLIMVTLTKPADASLGGLASSLGAVRQDVTAWLQSAQRSDIPWGITGIPAIEADETAQATQDSTIASIIAFLLVTLMLITVFRRVRLPLMAATALVIGIAWSFGWVAVSIGHLQLLSMVFSAILIGLGVDFALHIMTRLRVVQSEYDNLPDAMSKVFRDVGPGLLTGATTTAVAFGCTAFSAFLGVAEMGIIAAGGVMLCLVAVMSAFPALLALSSRWKNDLAVMRPLGANTLRHMVRPLHKRAGLVVFVGGTLTALLIMASTQLRYDSNIMNLQPPGLEAVTWQRALADEPGDDLWSGLIMTTPEQAPQLTEQLRSLAHVQSVGGMGMLFPADLASRQAKVAEVRAQPIKPPVVSMSLGFVPTVLSSVRDRLDGQPAFASIRDQLDAAVQSWHQLDRNAAERQARIDRLNTAWDQARPITTAWIAEALAPAPPGPSDLPPVLASQWVGVDGQWLLRVAPISGARSVLAPDRLATFVDEIRTVAPDVLGPPVQILESSRLIVRAYVASGLLAMIAVLLVLLLDFRSITDAATAMMPVFVGFAGTFGFMAIIGIELNFANLMVLPLIFGIGVDAGVHVVHRWRSDPSVRPPGLWGGTGSGILLTTATTAIGFGALMVAEHRGIRSLAIVMVIGLLVTLAAAWTILPAVLRLRQRRWQAISRRVDRHSADANRPQ